MKNFLSSVLCFLKSHFLQALLSIVAIVSFDNAYYLGIRTFRGSFDPNNVGGVKAIGTDVSTGFDGGALAIGHPLGASGARILGKAASLLNRIDGEYALASMCIGGGMGIATVLRRYE